MCSSDLDAVTLAVPALPAVGEEIAVRVDFTGTGRMQALSVALTWDPAVVEPVGYTAGDMVLDQGGLVLQDEPGTVDGASFAGPGTGLVGSGEFATLRFRVKAAGDAKFGFAKVEARDMQNHTIMPQHSVAAVAPKVFATAFAPAMPNPFNQRTTLRFSLAKVAQIGRAHV